MGAGLPPRICAMARRPASDPEKNPAASARISRRRRGWSMSLGRLTCTLSYKEGPILARHPRPGQCVYSRLPCGNIQDRGNVCRNIHASSTRTGGHRGFRAASLLPFQDLAQRLSTLHCAQSLPPQNGSPIGAASPMLRASGERPAPCGVHFQLDLEVLA